MSKNATPANHAAHQLDARPNVELSPQEADILLQLCEHGIKQGGAATARHVLPIMDKLIPLAALLQPLQTPQPTQ
jgi:hypothetical protein